MYKYKFKKYKKKLELYSSLMTGGTYDIKILNNLDLPLLELNDKIVNIKYFVFISKNQNRFEISDKCPQWLILNDDEYELLIYSYIYQLSKTILGNKILSNLKNIHIMCSKGLPAFKSGYINMPLSPYFIYEFAFDIDKIEQERKKIIDNNISDLNFLKILNYCIDIKNANPIDPEFVILYENSKYTEFIRNLFSNVMHFAPPFITFVHELLHYYSYIHNTRIDDNYMKNELNTIYGLSGYANIIEDMLISENTIRKELNLPERATYDTAIIVYEYGYNNRIDIPIFLGHDYVICPSKPYIDRSILSHKIESFDELHKINITYKNELDKLLHDENEITILMGNEHILIVSYNKERYEELGEKLKNINNIINKLKNTLEELEELEEDDDKKNIIQNLILKNENTQRQLEIDYNIEKEKTIKNDIHIKEYNKYRQEINIIQSEINKLSSELSKIQNKIYDYDRYLEEYKLNIEEYNKKNIEYDMLLKEYNDKLKVYNVEKMIPYYKLFI